MVCELYFRWWLRGIVEVHFAWSAPEVRRLDRFWRWLRFSRLLGLLLFSLEPLHVNAVRGLSASSAGTSSDVAAFGFSPIILRHDSFPFAAYADYCAYL